jgi:hypothetical protein
MTRNLKALCLALCAAVALSAAAAATASAVSEFKSNAPTEAHLTARQYTKGNTTNIHGEELKGKQEFQATTGDARTLRCNEVAAKGTFKSPATEITATNVEYKNCGAWETKEGVTKEVAKAFVEFTSCDYVFKSATEETPTPPVGTKKGKHAKVQIKCNTPGDHIHIKITEAKLACITIPEQVTGHGVRYFKDPEDETKVTIHATVHGIKSTTTPSIVCPTKSGGTEVHDTAANGGTYTGEITVEAFKDAAHTEAATLEETEAIKTSEG